MCLLRLRRRSQKPVTTQYAGNNRTISGDAAKQNTMQKAGQVVDRHRHMSTEKTSQEVDRLKRIAEQAYLSEDLKRQAERTQQEAEEERERVRREAERAQQEAERKRERVRREAERAQQEAERKRRRKLRDFWMSLSGRAFEHELATLYRQQGYQVQSTPTSGDEGVDLIIRKNGEKIVVQCKSHKYPVGPAIVRELYGSMHHFSADRAILACTGGFTSGVRDFVKGKPIELISAPELVMMANGREDRGIPKEQGNMQQVPQCPRCRKEMRLVSDRYVKFWGCTGYPGCRATKDA